MSFTFRPSNSPYAGAVYIP